MINSAMSDVLKDYKQVSCPTLTVEVPMELSGMEESLASLLRGEMYRIAGPVGSASVDEISVGDIQKYLSTLVVMRVMHVNNASAPWYSVYRRMYGRLAVPTFWYQVLICIGEALDRDYMIRLIPTTAATANNLLSIERLQQISDLLTMLEPQGMRIVNGLPKGEEGELGFMAMSHADQVTKSYRRDTHPVFAFLAAFFNTKKVEEVLGALVRITYGHDSDYRAMLARVVTASQRGGD